MAIEWHPFDYGNKSETAPPHELREEDVWIVERDIGVTVGYFDGSAFCLSSGNDCHVTHWAEIEYPAAPEGA
jgi:hypothetical protein